MDKRADLQPRNVLIVDDEPRVATLLATALQKLGDKYHCEMAQSSESALRLIQQTPVPYDLMITDYKMPGMSGVDLVHIVRKISPDTQVVIMTGHGTEQLRETVEHLNIGGYIDKPFTMAQIRAIVEHALERTKHHDPAPVDTPALDPAVYERVRTLRTDVGARCVILLSASGYPIEVDGVTENLDIPSLSALVAANFMAAAEVAKLLGGGSIFKSSHHEGPEYNIYSYDVNGQVLLAVIFGAESKPGIVWFYTKKTAIELAPLVVAPALAVNLGDNLRTVLDEQFTELFDDQEQSLLNLDGAVASGLIPAELLKAL
ncbi:MAG TPA: response regulator [Anaerolineae bacterium]|nr:response regulator [Anaerolineae bacterium]HQI86221.1 response regulator [Anaerolineae bacterium]